MENIRENSPVSHKSVFFGDWARNVKNQFLKSVAPICGPEILHPGLVISRVVRQIVSVTLHGWMHNTKLEQRAKVLRFLCSYDQRNRTYFQRAVNRPELGPESKSFSLLIVNRPEPGPESNDLILSNLAQIKWNRPEIGPESTDLILSNSTRVKANRPESNNSIIMARLNVN